MQIDVGGVLGFDSVLIESWARNAEDLLRQPTQLSEEAKWAAIRYFARSNAIKNQFAALAQHMLTAAQLDGAGSLDTAYSAWIESNRFGWNLASFRDPATAIFMQNALLDAAYFRKMLASMQGKSAQRRLHLLRLEIRKAKLTDDQIQHYLDGVSPALRNPQNTKPMRWDPTKRTLYASDIGAHGWRPEVTL